MRKLPLSAAYAISALIGALTWIYVAQLTGQREAWDSSLYFTTALPSVGLSAMLLGVLVPGRPWRWAVVPLAAQAAVLFAQNPTGNLMPLGLIAFGFFAALCCIPAYIGAYVRRLAIGRDPS